MVGILFCVLNNVELMECRCVELNGFADFFQTDVLIGRVRAGRVARTDFHGRERHQSLVAQRGRAERSFTRKYKPLHNRVIGGYR